MLFVRTFLGPSKIHGIGVFAAEPISKGDVIWMFKPGLDQELAPEFISTLPECAREEVARYGYVTRSGTTVLCADNARFFNHSLTPTTINFEDATSDKSSDLAAHDLVVGEEITSNYFTFDADAARKLGVNHGN